ncbi:MAG: PAS domain-containing protein [Chloroflexi bacterium]|nr:PAS domain-containing protein [Chloroflexota bacterium]
MTNDLAPQLIKNVLRDLGDGVTLFDADQRVVFWNARAAILLRLPAATILNQRAADVIEQIAARASAPNTTREQLRAGLAARDPARWIEMEIAPDSDDAARIVAARCFGVRDERGGEIGAGMLWRDVTRERTADAMKSQLLSTVSHELRTPLASIKGFATTLLRQDVKWDEATQRDFLRIIEEETDRLTEIIDNLLDMSQIEAGALRVAKEPTAVRQLIRAVVDEMRMRTEAHYFVVDLPAELPRVLIDPRRIRQVLTNLIGNAIKYSAKGQITIACEVENDRVVVSVSDQGEGIPPQYLDKVFERFFQVDGASTRRVGGSGLGLAIARGIIEAHDGKIWVERATGQGSTFRFTLPLARVESNGQAVGNE